MTKEEFKQRWESNASGGGITSHDIFNCAIAWGVCTPRTSQLDRILYCVLCAAGAVDAEEYKPEEHENEPH